MAANSKIKALEELGTELARLKKAGKKIVLCHGEFDLFHPGHLRYFIGSKKEGDILVVTITPDKFINRGPGRPVYNQQIRAEFIASLEIVDFVGINEWPTAVELLNILKPDVYCKGAEYKDREKDVTGRITIEENEIKKIGGRLHFVEDITFSSSSLINRFMNVYPENAVAFLNDLALRHNHDEIIAKIKKIQTLKILVIGDLILDEYCYCDALGKSPKSLNITTRFIASEMFAGGVLATTNHVAEFSNNLQMVTAVGDQTDYSDFIFTHLNPDIEHKLYRKLNSTTTLKRRFVDKAFIGKMFEVCFLDDNEIDKNLEQEISAYLQENINKYDIVIVNDFGHGLLTSGIRDVITSSSAFVAVNTQTNSANMGYNLITKYKRADYVCIDEPEMRLATHNKYGDIKELVLEISHALKCDTVTVTRGHKGCIVYNKKAGFAEAPVFSTHIVDTIGAGDAFFAVTAPLVRLGLTPEEIAFVGNAVGALAVLIVCNREPVHPQNLFKFITALLK